MWIIHDRIRQIKNDNIILRMRITCWITKAIDTHSEYEYVLLFKGKKFTRTPLDTAAHMY